MLNGDVELQLATMSAYLKDLSNQPLPEKIQHARDQNYELTPTDRPIILRTFMPVTGTHAIAVGFPQQVHFAFDAENLSLSQAWHGRFLDAEGTWFIRFAPPADPLGDKRINFRQESRSLSWTTKHPHGLLTQHPLEPNSEAINWINMACRHFCILFKVSM